MSPAGYARHGMTKSARVRLRLAPGRAIMWAVVSNPSARAPQQPSLPAGGGAAPAVASPSSPGKMCPKCRRRFDDRATTCVDDMTPLVAPSELAGIEGDPMVGRTLSGRFTVLSKLGAGSMGTVYRARQSAVGRDVAIKILRSDRAGDGTAKARFLREARANSLLASPHTVTVFDFGQSESGEFYLAMELLEGESLGQRLARVRRLPVEQAVETTRQALRSLAEAHAKGIIHRDLKPDNLFYARVKQGENGQVEELVKVLDFGIAKMLTDDGTSPMNAVETQAGTVFGTPRYMSPEQAQGKPLDARSDLYSLGVILYQMLTGRPPFTDNDAIVVMARHIKTAPKAASEACPEANIPPELEAALNRALAKDAKGRPANAEQMSNELARALDLGAAVTSGVRTVRPVSAGIVPAPAPAPPMGALSGPIEDPDSDPTARELLPSRRGRARGLVMLAVAGVVALGVALGLAASQGRRPMRATSPPLPTTTHASTPDAIADSPPALASPGLAPPGLAPPGKSPSTDAPTVNAENLPKAGATKPGWRPRGSGAKAPAAGTATAPSAPTAAPSSHYGIFE